MLKRDIKYSVTNSLTSFLMEFQNKNQIKMGDNKKLP